MAGVFGGSLGFLLSTGNRLSSTGNILSAKQDPSQNGKSKYKDRCVA